MFQEWAEKNDRRPSTKARGAPTFSVKAESPELCLRSPVPLGVITKDMPYDAPFVIREIGVASELLDVGA